MLDLDDDTKQRLRDVIDHMREVADYLERKHRLKEVQPEPGILLDDDDNGDGIGPLITKPPFLDVEVTIALGGSIARVVDAGIVTHYISYVIAAECWGFHDGLLKRGSNPQNVWFNVRWRLP